MADIQQRTASVLPSVERIQQELAGANSIDDFFGKDGIFARLFADTLEQMLEAELTAHLGYPHHAPEGRNSGNSRNGKRTRQLRTSSGDTTIQVPRDRNSSFQSPLLDAYQTSTNELEDKIIALYAKGMSARDIQDMLHQAYGVEVSPATISTVTDKVWSLVEAWQNRPLAAISPIVYLDAIHLKLRRDGKVANTAVYIVLGVDLDGQRDVLGHWVGDGAEGANFWLSVVTDLQGRGVMDIFIACIDGLTGFKDAIHAVFPRVQIQRCIIHQVRQSLTYVSWKDRKALLPSVGHRLHHISTFCCSSLVPGHLHPQQVARLCFPVCVERKRARHTPAQAPAHDDNQGTKLGVRTTADLRGGELAQMLAHPLGGYTRDQRIEILPVVR